MESTQRFTVILLPEDDGGYAVHFPYHPNVYTWADTVEDALGRAKGAIEAYLEAEAEDGADLMLAFADIPHLVVSEITANLSPAVQEQAARDAECATASTSSSDAARRGHFIGTRQAGEELGVSADRIRKLVLDGRVPGARKAGKEWLIPTPIQITPGSRGRKGVAHERR